MYIKRLILFLLLLSLFSACANAPKYVRYEKTGAYFDVDLDDNEALDIAYGGTNAASALEARNNLGVMIGRDVQGYNINLDTYATIAPSADVQTLLGAADQSAIVSSIGAEPADPLILKQGDIDDTAVEGEITVPISSNWAFNAEALIAAAGYGIIYTTTCASITEGFCVDIDGTDGTLGTITVSAGGSGYVDEDELTLDGGEGDAVVEATVVDGAVTAVTIVTPGTGYALDEYDVIGGSGTGAKITVTKFGDAGKFYYYATSLLQAPLDYLVGATGNIQAQIDAKQETYSAATQLKVGDTEVTITDTGTGTIEGKADGSTVFKATADGLETGNRVIAMSGLALGEWTGDQWGGITAGEAITAPAVVYMDKTLDQWMLADRDATGKWPADGLVVQSCEKDAVCEPLFFGVHRHGDYAFTRHDALCVSTTAGEIIKCSDVTEMIGSAIASDTIRVSMGPVAASAEYVPPAEPDPGESCTSYDTNISTTATSTTTVAKYDNQRHRGFIFSDSLSGDLCSVVWNISDVAGTIEGKTYYTELWTLDGSGNLSTRVATSSGVTGDSTWTDDDVEFSFTSPVAYDDASANYAIIIKQHTSGTAATAVGEVDLSNHIIFGIHTGEAVLTHSDGNIKRWGSTYNLTATSAGELLVTVKTMQ